MMSDCHVNRIVNFVDAAIFRTLCCKPPRP